MNKRNKIVLSSIAVLSLLLAGCTDEQTAAAAALNSDSTIASATERGSRNTSHGSTANNGNTELAVTGGNNHNDDSSGDTGDNNTGDDLIPGDGNDADIPAANNQTGGWYGRTVVAATAADGTVYQHSTAGVFGELIDSDESIDQHDIPGYGAAILQVVFPQDDGTSNGDFFSNYQDFDETSKKTWTFQIKNQHTVDLKDAPITIALPEVKKVTYKKVDGKIVYGDEITDENMMAQLTLIDVDNATSYTVDQLATANLTMDGLHTRTFKWVLGAVETADYIATEAVDKDINIAASQSLDIEANESPITADGFDTSTLKTANSGGKFGLPPM